MPNDEKHIGEGVYMSVEFSTCIRLRTERPFRDPNEPNDFIYLDPRMFQEMLKQAYELGWDIVIRE